MTSPEIKPSTPVDYTNPRSNPVSPTNAAPNLAPVEPTSEEPDEGSSNKVRSIISTVALFLAAPLLALVLIMFVIQSYEVDGPSMEETLQNKDLLIVSKIPKTIATITGKPYIPPRYEVIIFSRDEGGGTGGQTRQLVKRVIALPGERVTVADGKVTVYSQQNPSGFNPDENQDYSESIETTPGNVDLTVREGEVFVLGDNRNNSLDSRFFGSVNANEIVGKLGVRIFPLNQARSF